MVTRSVHATTDEATRALPGDELIPSAIDALTHAVTIHAPSREVWPWLVQMGAGSRGGWYSYDLLDNGRQPSANRIVPELQSIAVGSLFPAMPGITDGFHVLRIDEGAALVLGWRPASATPPIMTWAFVLNERPAGLTRLIVRARASDEYPFHGLPPWIGKPLMRVMHFVMERRQLLGIAMRVEARGQG
jgi:hypothetical protein